MALSFPCECGQQLQANEEDAGRRTRCPKCGRDAIIPSIEATLAPQRPPRPEAVTGRPGPDASHPDEDDGDGPPAPRWHSPEKTSKAAVVSLVLGILSLVCFGLPAIPAIILGIVALSAISRSRGRLGGQGFAVAGTVLGAVGLVLMIPALLIGLLVPAVQKVRQAAARMQSTNNLKQISLALINYSDTNKRLPPAVVYDADGKPLYSWRVLLLPYVEEEELYREFHLDEPWDSPHNKALLPRMPKVYAAPGEWPPKEPYATYYQVFDGPGAAFNSDKSQGLQPFSLLPPSPSGKQVMAGNTIIHYPGDFADGTSNTFLVVEAGDPVPWSKPADLPFDPNGPPPNLGGLLFGNTFNAAFADSSVRAIPRSTDPRTIRAYVTIRGGEAVPP